MRNLLRMKTDNFFKSEEDMAVIFSQLLYQLRQSNNITFLTEQKGLFGIPDFILIENKLPDSKLIIAIELKLKNWKQALKQAYKYKSFSNYSFVVLDEINLKAAINNLEMFKNFNIGLSSFNPKKELKIVYYPNFEIPFNPQLVDKIYYEVQPKYILDSKKISLPFKFHEDVCLPVRF